MDAKITKNRLANMISYDWMKIIFVCIAAIVGINLLYTMIATRVKDEQTFLLYAYGGIEAGEDSTSFSQRFLQDDFFSYEIMKASVDYIQGSSSSSLFSSGTSSSELYMARLTDTGRTALLLPQLKDSTSDGYGVAVSMIYENGNHDYLDVREYLSDCEVYLKEYFGEDWRTGTLDKDKAKECFLNRNGKDKRFLKEEKKAVGIEQEYARFEKLRTDYITLLGQFDAGYLSFASLTIDEVAAEEYSRPQGTYECGISLGGLKNLRKFCCYSVTTENEDGTTSSTVSAEDITLLFYKTEALANKQNDLRFESISFLTRLVETYGA